MARIISVFFFSIIWLFTNAQSFPLASQEPVWRVSYTSFPFSQGELTIFAGPEQDLCGQLWTPAFEAFSSGDTTEAGFYRVEGRRVYYRRDANCANREYLLYDFGLENRDSAYIIRPPVLFTFEDTVSYHVLLTGEDFYGPTRRKSMEVIFIGEDQAADFYQTVWLEGVGDLLYPFPTAFCAGGGGCHIDYRVECLSTNEGVWFAREGQEGCRYSGRIYVDRDAPGPAQDGKNWATAFTNLQDALSAAQYGDSIWIANGVYYPAEDNDRAASFNLKNGVPVYGGFAGYEDELEQRDWLANPSVLSGDIGIAGDSLDNSYHVIRAIGTGPNTLIDGLHISDGQADGQAFDNRYGGGIFLSSYNAAEEAYLTIRNCSFAHNTGRNGGAFGSDGTGEQLILPQFFNCRFINNRAISQGGAFFKQGTNAGQDTLSFFNCTFEDNTAWMGGGAIYYDSFCQPLKLHNCRFENNTTTLEGGAVSLIAYCNKGWLALDSCHFQSNESNMGGAVSLIFTNFAPDRDTVIINVRQSTFSNNLSTSDPGGGLSFSLDRTISILNIENCRFIENIALSSGGGIYINLSLDNIIFSKIKKCAFTRNDGNHPLGGAIRIRGFLESFVESYNTIENCLFEENTGAIFITSGKPGIAESLITNCTFYNNGEADIAKNWSPDFDYEHFYNRITVNNSILHRAENLDIERHFANGVPMGAPSNLYGWNVSHCLVSADTCNLPGADLACGEGMIFSAAPLFLDPADHNFHLAACSPAINAGDNRPADSLGIQTALDGNPRILEGTVDLGAYERESFHILGLEAQPPACAGSNNGYIGFLANGSDPYTYSWQNETGETGTGQGSLTGGIYLFTLTDSFGCSDTALVHLAEPLPIQVEAEVAPASAGQPGAIILAPASGGTPPYSYLWNTNDTATTLSGLAPGVYTLSVTDAAHCIGEFTFTVEMINGFREQEPKGELAIFPNPSDHTVFLAWPGLANKAASLAIFNVRGEKVYHAKLNGERSLHEWPAAAEWPAGLYFCRLELADGSALEGKAVLKR